MPIAQATALVKVDSRTTRVEFKNRVRDGHDRKKKQKHTITMYNVIIILAILLSWLGGMGNAQPTKTVLGSQTLAMRSDDLLHANFTRNDKMNVLGNPAKLDRKDLADPNVDITVHNMLATNKPIYFYISGFVDPSGSQSVLLADGTWQLLDAGGSGTPIPISADLAYMVPPQGSTTITLPTYVNSSRLYAFEGVPMSWSMVGAASGKSTVVQPVVTVPGTPAYNTRWGIVEFTSNQDEFFVNLSFVDFVALAFGISVVDKNGASYQVPGLLRTLPGQPTLVGNSNISSSDYPSVSAEICAGLKAQDEKDGHKWSSLCIYNNTATSTLPADVPLRVLSPQQAWIQGINFTNASYYDDYIAQAWTQYTANPLTIDTQAPWIGSSGPNMTYVTCQVNPTTDNLTCSNTNATMQRPVIKDVWTCNSGAFVVPDKSDAVFAAVVPRVCAAFARSTLLLDGGNVQPGPLNSTFYGGDGGAGGQDVPTNHYARVVHEAEVVGGYAFSFDDVNVPGENENGAIAVGSASSLDIYIGQ